MGGERVCSQGTRGCLYIGQAQHECSGSPIAPWTAKQVRKLVREEIEGALDWDRRLGELAARVEALEAAR